MFKEAFKKLPKTAWQPSERKKAFQLFEKAGLPSTKNEEWKYTSLKTFQDKIFSSGFKLGSKELLKHQAVKSWFTHFQISPWQIVFADGHFIKELSRLPNDKKLCVQSLSEAAKKHPKEVAAFYKDKNLKSKTFANLNQALALSGAFIWAKKNCEVTEPLVIVHLSTQKETASQYRNLIKMETGAQIQVVEIFKGFENDCFLNAVTQVTLAQASKLVYYKSQEENTKSYHVHTLHADLEKESELITHLFSVGGLLVRNEIQVNLEKEHARVELNGLFAAGEKQHVDNNTTINHFVPHCQSEEIYKGILDGSSHGVFSGKVLVAEDAQKTDSKQSSKNLLLSDDAQVDTKPQLMIYADDVKCSHGATIGQLDKQQLFYLQSRGINIEEGKQILIKAFCQEMIEKIKHEKVKEYFERTMMTWFNQQTLH